MRVIATDVDGTLLRSDHTISRRTMATLLDALGAGWPVIPISGRHPYSILPLVDRTPLLGYCVGSNGAVGMNLRTHQVLFEQTIAVDAQREFVTLMRAAVPGVMVCSIRDAGRTFVPQVGYVGMMDPGDHGRDEAELAEYPLDVVLARPSLKLALRHREVDEAQLLAVARGFGLDGVHPSTSGAPFLEVAGGGVTKATGMERLCEVLGLRREDVVAFGDNINDAELLAWAGHGVAMGNALPEARAAADEVTAANDQDGLALVVERLLREG